MATNKSGISYETIINDIKSRKFAPIYVLMGEESYFIDRICDAISETVLPPEEREFNQFVMFGADVNASQIAMYARELPMMSEYKVIIVKEAQNLRNHDDLEKYLAHPSPQTILVLCHKHGTIDRRKKFISHAEQVGVVFESTPVKDSALPGFIENYLKAKNVKADHNVVGILSATIGTDLSRLSSDLDKLCLALPEDNKVVTPELVESCIGVSKTYNPFEFRTAIANHNFVKSMTIANYFDITPKAGGVFSLMSTLFSYFQNLMLAWYAPNRNSSAAIAEHLELRGEWQAREYMTGMRYYNAMKTMQIISKLREIDEKSKGLDNPNTSASDLLKELVCFIFS